MIGGDQRGEGQSNTTCTGNCTGRVPIATKSFQNCGRNTNTTSLLQEKKFQCLQRGKSTV